jgi:hypothetical protein
MSLSLLFYKKKRSERGANEANSYSGSWKSRIQTLPRGTAISIGVFVVFYGLSRQILR